MPGRHYGFQPTLPGSPLRYLTTMAPDRLRMRIISGLADHMHFRSSSAESFDLLGKTKIMDGDPVARQRFRSRPRSHQPWTLAKGRSLLGGIPTRNSALMK